VGVSTFPSETSTPLSYLTVHSAAGAFEMTSGTMPWEENDSIERNLTKRMAEEERGERREERREIIERRETARGRERPF
ncbi:hypothetical protein PFISCL1PPCAC_10249, partial [Pristionchus fissidentatus]